MQSCQVGHCQNNHGCVPLVAHGHEHTGAYAISPVVERASSAQHLQLASGCPPAAYWAGSFAWDMVSHLAVTLLSLAIFAAYGDEATIGSFDQVWMRLQLTPDRARLGT